MQKASRTFKNPYEVSELVQWFLEIKMQLTNKDKSPVCCAWKNTAQCKLISQHSFMHQQKMYLNISWYEEYSSLAIYKSMNINKKSAMCLATHHIA